MLSSLDWVGLKQGESSDFENEIYKCLIIHKLFYLHYTHILCVKEVLRDLHRRLQLIALETDRWIVEGCVHVHDCS